jgi:6-phosphogluconolactonase
VGTYSEPILFGTGQMMPGSGEGIHVFRFDPGSGALSVASVAAGVRNPSFLVSAPDKRFLYCVNELKELDGKPSGGASAFGVDAGSGTLVHLNTRITHGTDPCHLAVDATGRHLLTASYGGGSLCVLPIRPDGSLAEAAQVVQHQGRSLDPVRQSGPHAHAVVIDAGNRFVLVPDLGLDKVMIYAFEAAQDRLRPNPAQPWLATRPGAGPRQLAMHPSGRFAYLINELDSTLTALSWDGSSGALGELQTLSTLPPGASVASTGAQVQVSPCGRFVYGSNRGHDSIVVLAVEPATGLLTVRGHESTRGRAPRHFSLSPDGAHLIVANQDSDDVFVFRIDAGTGLLQWTGQHARVGTPVCVCFL